MQVFRVSPLRTKVFLIVRVIRSVNFLVERIYAGDVCAALMLILPLLPSPPRIPHAATFVIAIATILTTPQRYHQLSHPFPVVSRSLDPTSRHHGHGIIVSTHGVLPFHPIFISCTISDADCI